MTLKGQRRVAQPAAKARSLERCVPRRVQSQQGSQWCYCMHIVQAGGAELCNMTCTLLQRGQAFGALFRAPHSGYAPPIEGHRQVALDEKAVLGTLNVILAEATALLVSIEQLVGPCRQGLATDSDLALTSLLRLARDSLAAMNALTRCAGALCAAL